MKEQLIPITVMKDNEGDIYFIPSNLKSAFDNMCRWYEEDENSELWNKADDLFYDVFVAYKLEGDLSDYQHYISQKELNKLTQ